MNKRNFQSVRRIVVKIGTNLLSERSGVDAAYLQSAVQQLAALHNADYQVVLVSSGAIGIGAKELGLDKRVTSIRMRQACHSIGQPILMRYYIDLFRTYRIAASQLLLTREVLNNRKSFLNIRNTFEMLLELGSVPVCNENDSVSTAEIGNAFGDNDKLSALIASKIDADLLVLLTDTDGLYSANPKTDPNAQFIYQVDDIDDRIRKYAGGEHSRGSTHSTGGMKTKIAAAEIASQAGCATVIAHGREQAVIERILQGELIGTYFPAKEKRSQRQRWIINTQPQGRIFIDSGAEEALRRNKSLLPSGVKRVEGVFHEGEVVMINDAAKAVVSLNSTELELLSGCHSTEIRKKLGDGHRDVVARPEDIVFLDAE